MLVLTKALRVVFLAGPHLAGSKVAKLSEVLEILLPGAAAAIVGSDAWWH